MILRLLTPERILIDREVYKVIAEAPNGFFAILPKHIDFVASLVPSVLAFVDEDGIEHFIGVDEGVLVKCSSEVLVSVRNAAQEDDLSALRSAVEDRFLKLSEYDRSARSALARLEAGLVRRFIEMREHP